MNLTDLESAVLEKLLQGDHAVLTALRAQLPHLSVSRREYSGAGFYTEFETARDSLPASYPNVSVVFGDVEAQISGLAHGAGFLLYAEGGLIRMLEGYSYDEPWPPVVSEFSLRYSDPTRKGVLSKLRACGEIS